jgi:predicted metalloprotease with PDZ domain
LRPSFATSLFVACLTLCAGCGIGRPPLLKEPPPLHDMEEPLDLRPEPADEAQREALPPGSFTGVHAADKAQTLDAMMEESNGVLVESVVENSPADVAGVMADDVILEARAGGKTTPLHWPSEWRALELDAQPGTQLALSLDRAGKELEVTLTTSPRARPADRAQSERYREEDKVGVVVRTATEVEARAAGLGPGGGAVVVGLSRASPWRSVESGEHAREGLMFGDLITAVDGAPVAHPQVVIDAIRAHKPDEKMHVTFVRAGATRTLDLFVSRRASELREVSIPILYSYRDDRGHVETSFLLGLYKYEHTKTAWRTRILWIIHFGGGEADRLEEERS